MLSNKNPVLPQGNEGIFCVTSKCIFNLPFTIKSIIQLVMIFEYDMWEDVGLAQWLANCGGLPTTTTDLDSPFQ